MAELTKVQSNLGIVLSRLKNLVAEDSDFADEVADVLTDWLNDDPLFKNKDPRGNHYEGVWSIYGEIQEKDLS